MPHSIDFDTIEDGPTISAATVHYRHMLTRRTPAEIHTLSHIKRFMERLIGDLSFRVALGENLDNPRPVVERHGIDVDPKEMLPLWHSAYLRYRRNAANGRWRSCGTSTWARCCTIATCCATAAT